MQNNEQLLKKCINENALCMKFKLKTTMSATITTTTTATTYKLTLP